MQIVFTSSWLPKIVEKIESQDSTTSNDRYCQILNCCQHCSLESWIRSHRAACLYTAGRQDNGNVNSDHWWLSPKKRGDSENTLEIILCTSLAKSPSSGCCDQVMKALLQLSIVCHLINSSQCRRVRWDGSGRFNDESSYHGSSSDSESWPIRCSIRPSWIAS